MTSLKFVTAMLVLHALAHDSPGQSALDTATIRTKPEFSFERDVALIFARRCIECHQDRIKNGGISFQSDQGMNLDELVDLDEPAESDLLIQVTPDQFGHAEMPKGRTALKAEEIAHLRHWIENGAKWPANFRIDPAAIANTNWWSLKSLVKPPLPEVAIDAADWSINPIDRFVLHELSKNGLRPSPPADRRTLIRRLYYDLIGLPPTKLEVDAFENDETPDSFAKLVDRLLASPHYGERWARHWLDQVHYGDTHGFDKDKVRPSAWHYRDYLIRSLNSDKPYDQFIKEQIAGDVLFPDEPEATIATGMIVAGPFDWVGQIEVANDTLEKLRVRNLDRDDMVATVMNTFVSTTVQCARCHNHKFDPVSQLDYYSMQSIFAGIDRAQVAVPDKTARQKIKILRQRKAEFDLRRSEIIKAYEVLTAPKLAPIQKEIKKQLVLRDAQASPFSKSDSKSSTNGYHSQFAKTADEEKWIEFSFENPQTIESIVLYPARPVDFPDTPGFAFPQRWKVELFANGDEGFVLVNETEADFDNPGDRFLSFEVKSNKKYKSIRLTATKLATRSPSDDKYALALAEFQIFSDGKNIAPASSVSTLDSIDSGLWSMQNLTDNQTSRQKLVVGDAQSKFARSLFELSKFAQKLNQLRDAENEILNSVGVAQRKEIGYLNTRIRKLDDQLIGLEKSRLAFVAATNFKSEGQFVSTSGMPRDVFLLNRGDEAAPRKAAGPVRPGAITAMTALRHHFEGVDLKNEGARRAALANWIADEANPLTWRSIANRVWQHHFGAGIVASTNDFGRMGSTPTHTELLDWLAAEFRDAKSLKQLHRMIVTSATYRQASTHDAEKAAIDSNNQFLWRMNRRRLDAEQIRDSILVAAGKLDKKMYGAPFLTFELEDDHSPRYDYAKFDANDPLSLRRSIYRFVVRSVPDPFFESLDCADPSQIVARRSETTTALQALTMLNNQFTVSMARQLANELQEVSDSPRQQIVSAYGRILGREPVEKELELTQELASKFSLFSVCRALLNCNEFVFVD